MKLNRELAEDLFWGALLLICLLLQGYVATKVGDWTGVLDQFN